jgi:hypothetical protein
MWQSFFGLSSDQWSILSQVATGFFAFIAVAVGVPHWIGSRRALRHDIVNDLFTEYSKDDGKQSISCTSHSREALAKGSATELLTITTEGNRSTTIKGTTNDLVMNFILLVEGFHSSTSALLFGRRDGMPKESSGSFGHKMIRRS